MLACDYPCCWLQFGLGWVWVPGRLQSSLPLPGVLCPPPRCCQLVSIMLQVCVLAQAVWLWVSILPLKFKPCWWAQLNRARCCSCCMLVCNNLGVIPQKGLFSKRMITCESSLTENQFDSLNVAADNLVYIVFSEWERSNSKRCSWFVFENVSKRRQSGSMFVDELSEWSSYTMSNWISVCDKWGQPCCNQIRGPKWRAANVPPCDPVHSFYYSRELMRLALKESCSFRKRQHRPTSAAAGSHSTVPSLASRFSHLSLSSVVWLCWCVARVGSLLYYAANPCLCLGSPPQETQDQLSAGCPAGGSAVPNASPAQEGTEGKKWAHRQGAPGWWRRACQRRRTPRGWASRESEARGRFSWEGKEWQGTANQRQTRHREGHQPSHHEEAQQQKDQVSVHVRASAVSLDVVCAGIIPHRCVSVFLQTQIRQPSELSQRQTQHTIWQIDNQDQQELSHFQVCCPLSYYQPLHFSAAEHMALHPWMHSTS